MRKNKTRSIRSSIFLAMWILLLSSYLTYNNYKRDTIVIAVDLPLSHTVELSAKEGNNKFEFEGSAFFGDYKNDPERLSIIDLKALGLKRSDFKELYDMTFYKESTNYLRTVVCIFPSEKIEHIDFLSNVPTINQFYNYDNDHYMMLKIRGQYFAPTQQQVENFIRMEQNILTPRAMLKKSISKQLF